MVFVGRQQSTLAQEIPMTMQMLIGSLIEDIDELQGPIEIHLVTPVDEIDTFYIPIEDESGIPTITISEIGDDYLCIQYYGGGANAIYCIPYSNISMIYYEDFSL
jgi:hypothetical protein